MTNAVGRPISPLVLSADERAYRERQVRRRRVARSLSERCRVILRFADGVPGKFRSLNHGRGGIINPQRFVAADANGLTFLPLAAA